MTDNIVKQSPAHNTFVCNTMNLFVFYFEGKKGSEQKTETRERKFL